jgi:hypothetical protein
MEFVKGITSDHDLIALGKRIGVRIDGIYELPEIKAPFPEKGSYLILLRTGPGVGHWTAWRCHPRHAPGATPVVDKPGDHVVDPFVPPPPHS